MFSKGFWGVVLLIAAFVAIVGGVRCFENLDADEIMIVQSIDGTLTMHVDQGLKYIGFGKSTFYPRRSIYNFKVPVRFNDAGHGTIEGSIQYDMPLDFEHLKMVHQKYGNSEAIQSDLIQTVVNKCAYMTGPLMSSRESYAEKRNDLLFFIDDQILNGVYQTALKDTKTLDPVTGVEKTVTIVEILKGQDGNPKRQEKPILPEFGIKPFGLAIERIPYDETVERQIQQQQQITMDVQTAIADAKKAEQRTITITEQGKAEAAKAKWEQEVLKAQAVTLAQQKLEVAELAAQEAAAYKEEQLLRADADSEYRRRIMAADGALQQRLDAAVEINKAYADALKNHQGNIVPSVIMGNNGSGGPTTSSTQLIDLLMASTAKQLSLEVGVSKSSSAPSGK